MERSKREKNVTPKLSEHHGAGPSIGGAAQPHGGASRTRRGPIAWFRARHPVFRFISTLLFSLLVFEILINLPYVKRVLIPPYLRFTAQVCGGIVHLFDDTVTAQRDSLVSPRFSVSIAQGCDALQPTVLFLSAVIGSPVAWRRKPVGFALGVFFLMIMNQVRVISLFYIGIHLPTWFDIMHYDVWQAAFIFFSILAWALWALWALRPPKPVAADAV